MLARELSDWPDGVVPVWTVLGAKGLATLKREPSPENRALRLATDLGEEGLTECAFVRNALVLMRATVEGPDALRLTANGTLSLASVAAMRGAMAWPDMEATEHFREGTKYRERDVWELHLLRRLVETAGLIGRGGLWFELTPLGGTMLDPGNRGALHALLFRNLFWHTDLSLIVGGLVRRVPGRWPQGEIRRDSLVVGQRGRGVAKYGYADGVVRGIGEHDYGGIPIDCDMAVLGTRAVDIALVRTDGMARAAGNVRRWSLAQDRAVRSLSCRSMSHLRTAGRPATSPCDGGGEGPCMGAHEPVTRRPNGQDAGSGSLR